MDEYLLYLDESLTHDNGKNKTFSIGGIIVNKCYLPSLEKNFNEIKKTIWSDIKDPSSVILHEKDLKAALHNRIPINEVSPDYRRFRRNKEKANLLYKRMNMLVRKSEIKTMGCVVKKDFYDQRFPEDIGNEVSLVCMQVIIENFTHFLYYNDSVGTVIYESRDTQDKFMRMRFYQIASIGTMYISPFAVQHHVKCIEFHEKSENIVGLQIADFVPNAIARKLSGKKIYSNAIDLTKNIFAKAYDGNENNKLRYGIKSIPKSFQNLGELRNVF